VTRTLRKQQLPASDTALLGLGGMLGAGIFAGLSPASAAAGRYALVGVVIAALLAMCGAFSTADQSRVFPGSGAGYRYTLRLLGRCPSRMAASASIAGRAAAAAAVAGTFGAYVTPPHPQYGAIGVLAVSVAVDVVGFRLGRRLNWAVVVIVLAVLALVAAVCFAVPPPRITDAPNADDPKGLLTAAGTMVFAFLGFERMTAPASGELSAGPRRLRFVIPIVLVITLATYLTVGSAVWRQLGSTRLALSPVPLLDAVVSADGAWITPVVVVGAAAATVSALLAVLSGLRTTVGSVAKEGDLPAVLGADKVAGWCGGVLAAVLVFTVDTPTAIGFAACSMLAYYAFTNASARILLKEDRTWPMRSACFGLGLSVLLGMTMPPLLLGSTVAVVLLGAAALGAYRRLV
jgi:basic amino acid/polyamine antiporter, APA family